MSLRHRPSSLTDSHRRNSTLSDSVSEARNSIRSSTDDLFLPRVVKDAESALPDDESESNWQSAPLALALVPAVAGVFFHNGSAVLTDVTLLVLAAIFLNWSVRLPWYAAVSVFNIHKILTPSRDWYRSAQAIRQQESSKYYDAAEIQLADGGSSDSSKHDDDHRQSAALAASRELQLHELAALVSCFILPLIGTWLLHTIRAKLSRPSEGLVSNYNLTIFLLAAEIRPVSHLLKLVQARTLYLQRIVASSSGPSAEEVRINADKIAEVTTRLDELEAHVANNAAAAAGTPAATSHSTSTEPNPPNPQSQSPSPSTQTTTDIRKDLQPEIDALNRAMRRYEKRSALTTFQTDTRLRDLESRLRDSHALVMATASAQQQRSDSSIRPFRRGIFSLMFRCVYAVLFIPVQIFMSMVAIPGRVLAGFRDLLFPPGHGPGPSRQQQELGSRRAREGVQKGKMPRGTNIHTPAEYRSYRPSSKKMQRGAPGNDVGRGLGKSIPEHE